MTDVLAGSPHPAHSTVNGSPFPPIADYGFLSDCEVCALVAPSGSVEWIGEVDRARALCEKLLSYASPLSLYAEEIDAHSGRQLGNFPQAFSHLALINALMHLIREDERRSDGTVSARFDLHASIPDQTARRES